LTLTLLYDKNGEISNYSAARKGFATNGDRNL
jgi:hypothetical protein